jgi:hypothetical protein
MDLLVKNRGLWSSTLTLEGLTKKYLALHTLFFSMTNHHQVL